MEDDIHWKTTSNGRRHLMTDDLKICKVEYISNHFLDQTQIVDLSLNDQTIFYKSLHCILPTMEDDLRYKDDLKVSQI